MSLWVMTYVLHYAAVKCNSLKWSYGHWGMFPVSEWVPLTHTRARTHAHTRTDVERWLLLTPNLTVHTTLRTAWLAVTNLLNRNLHLLQNSQPLLTFVKFLRHNWERCISIALGWNEVLYNNFSKFLAKIARDRQWKSPSCPSRNNARLETRMIVICIKCTVYSRNGGRWRNEKFPLEKGRTVETMGFIRNEHNTNRQTK